MDNAIQGLKIVYSFDCDAVAASGDFAMEDMFPEEYYLSMANESHREKLKAAHQTNIRLVGKGLLVDRVARGCEQIGMAFNKGSVAKLIRRELSKVDDLAKLPPETMVHAEKLFDALNRVFDS
jgi:hypothetical protein